MFITPVTTLDLAEQDGIGLKHVAALGNKWWRTQCFFCDRVSPEIHLFNVLRIMAAAQAAGFLFVRDGHVFYPVCGTCARDPAKTWYGTPLPDFLLPADRSS